MLEYHAAYYRVEDGWYMARVLDFPGTISQGKNLQDARRMIRDALQLMVDYYLDEGKALPKPNPRARDSKATKAEKVRVRVQVQARAAS